MNVGVGEGQEEMYDLSRQNLWGHSFVRQWVTIGGMILPLL